MAIIKPFKGIRPPRNLVHQIVSRPYDVLSSKEAYEEAKGNEKSLYRIIKPEIDFPEIINEYHPDVYNKAAENFAKFINNGWLVQDENEYYYVYGQTMNKRTQYGLVVCNHVSDYESGKIKKHELTRKDKEEDRMKHVRSVNANIEPVFYAYHDVDDLNKIVKYVVEAPAEYDFVTDDNIGHHFWVIKDQELIDKITQLFEQIPALYVADGHHRSAAAALVAKEKAKENPHHTGDEEYNYFMSVCFPASQLKVMDYNRVVKDLNGLTTDQILAMLKQNFLVEEKDNLIVQPAKPHEFSIYMGGKCYYLRARAHVVNDVDPIDALDVTISSRHILDEIFGITDLRSDKRIDFVGGIRGLDALKELVDSGEMKFALALYPVTMEQIIDIADSGNIMPPKTTWFEPKLRSGLVIHRLD